jgi:hypothetical protein
MFSGMVTVAAVLSSFNAAGICMAEYAFLDF